MSTAPALDHLHRFVFEGLPVRGSLVQLGASWREMLARRSPEAALPVAVRALLGEMTAAGLLMQSNIKFNGSLILQMQGDGPVSLAVAEVQSDLSFRATAKVKDTLPDMAGLQGMLNVHGRGRCAITLDPKDRMPGQQPYQGIVPLHGDQREPLHRLSQVLEHYMLQSEQLDTRLVLAADDQCAAGLLIQRMPVEGSGNLGGRNEDEIGLNEGFNRIAHLTATLSPAELLQLDAATILRRLYWEETLQHFEPHTVRFACTCHRERVGRMLRGLGREECDSLIAERGLAEVGCDFCGQFYRFDAVDIGLLFAPAAAQGTAGNG